MFCDFGAVFVVCCLMDVVCRVLYVARWLLLVVVAWSSLCVVCCCLFVVCFAVCCALIVCWLFSGFWLLEDCWLLFAPCVSVVLVC